MTSSGSLELVRAHPVVGIIRGIANLDILFGHVDLLDLAGGPAADTLVPRLALITDSPNAAAVSPGERGLSWRGLLLRLS